MCKMRMEVIVINKFVLALLMMFIFAGCATSNLNSMQARVPAQDSNVITRYIDITDRDPSTCLNPKGSNEIRSMIEFASTKLRCTMDVQKVEIRKLSSGGENSFCEIQMIPRCQ